MQPRFAGRGIAMAGTMSGGMPPPAPGWGPPPAAQMKRPVGVTILAVLTILFGILGLLSGLLLLAASALIAAALPQYASVVGLVVAFAAVLTLISIVSIVAGVGLLRLRKWAWWLTIIVSILNIFVSIGTYAVYPVGGFPFGIILWNIILIYLVLVRRHFGMGSPKPAGHTGM